jgi:hypothetical protein
MLAGAGILGAADDATTTADAATVKTLSQNDEIARLKAALAQQQQQLQMLQQTLAGQQALLDQAVGTAGNGKTGTFTGIGQVASTTPIVPVAPLPAVAFPSPIAGPRPQAGAAAAKNPCEAAPDQNAVPPYLRLGNVCIIPVGFMDLTPVWRDKNAGSSMGSNFGSVPYNNTTNGNLSEYRFSIQNSRLGFRVDGDWKGVHFIGYNEFDFNGTSGSSSLAVSNGAVVPRLRLYWADVRKGKVEYLVGQSWSMLVPNRKGISALPGDLFYSQVIDINYIAGLTWTRQPGMRVLYHANDKITFGFSAEQPDQYVGGSAGGSSSVLPAAYLSLQGTQLDGGANLGACTNNTAVTGTAVSYGCTGQGYLAQPTVHPDFIAKVAFDPNSHLHIDLAGIESGFKTVNPALLSQHFTKEGGGVELGINAEIVKNFRLISTNYWSDGGGRYIFGQAPDLIVRGDGSLSLVHAGSTIEGFEARVKYTLLYGYYSGIYIGRNSAFDANGTTRVGYGYSGSSNSQNRDIQEITFGFNQTMWSNPRYGAINVMGQYEWLLREPWFVAAGAPKETHDNTIYFNVRYTLPGSMPNF